METTYRLRPNLQWHDGQPLTAEDFVFAYRAYTKPDIAIWSSTSPQDKMEEVLAPDPRTVVIKWRSAYPRAGSLSQGDFDPLPRHLLESSLDLDPDTFANLRFWTTDYVGAGPYKLVSWDPGVSIEGVAFDAHALGKPKITRVIRRFFADENAVLANVLSGDIDFADITTLRFNHGQTLQQEWVAAGRGRLLFLPTAPLAPTIQFRPDFQKSPPLLDARVRRALVHAMDKDGVSEALYPGVPSTRAETLISKLEAYYDQVDKAIAHYPYDARRAEQLMNEAGLTKDRDGLFADSAGTRFQPYFQVLTNVDSQRMQLVVSDSWKRAGIDVQPDVLPQALTRDPDTRARSNVGMATAGSSLGVESSMVATLHSGRCNLRSALGGKCGSGWVNPEYDRLVDAYDTTLNRTEQVQRVVDIMKIHSEELPSLPVYYNIYVLGVATGLDGPTVGTAGTHYWNLQDWTFPQ
jgi:peptide/nickel transport system substrate-binding protein